MSKYRVFGDKLISYYTTVTADSPDNAWEFAANNDNIDWIQIEKDAPVEIHFVELEQDTSDLLEDGYPSMANEIIVTDKSDK